MTIEKEWRNRWKRTAKTLRHALYWRYKEIEREVSVDVRHKTLLEVAQIAKRVEDAGDRAEDVYYQLLGMIRDEQTP